MLLVTGKIITLSSIYSWTFVCSVLFFHSFCQDQHCYPHSGHQLLLLYNSNTFFGQSRRKGFSPSPLLILFALLWKSLLSSMMPQVCPTPRYYMADVESWIQPPSLRAFPSPMSAKGHWVSFPHVARHSSPPTHLGTVVFQLQYSRPQSHPTTLKNLLSIELPASGRDCNWG